MGFQASQFPVSISDDNGEMPLKGGTTRDAKLDRGDFSSIWWNVFRSFVTPLVFLRYVADLLSMSSSPTKSLYSFYESAMSAPQITTFPLPQVSHKSLMFVGTS